ncbi:MAG: hypothetical protein ACTSVU_00340 [Promethearchaeota archaeon]
MPREVNLEELKDWYIESLQNRFKHEHKALKKFFTQAEREIQEVKASFKSWSNKKWEEEEIKLDEKSIKMVIRFSESMIKTTSDIKIPSVNTEISYENSQKFIDSIKKIYFTYNSEGKKVLKRFGKSMKLEIKEVDLHLRKIGNISAKINKFLLKHYQGGKVAEALLNRIPLLQNNINRLGEIKNKIDKMDTEFVDMKKNLEDLEEALYKFSQDPDLQKYEKMEQSEIKLTTDLREALKFKKAFKKLKKSIEKGNIVSKGIRDRDLKPYTSSSVNEIIQQGPKIPHLRDVLIKTRLILENETNPLQLKTELREKIIGNINKIVNKDFLGPKINGIIQIRENKSELKKILEKKGIGQKRQDLKDKIAVLTADKDHFENDLRHRKKEFKELIAKVVEERKNLQQKILDETEEEIKLKINIPA